ncbi:hypothetical protein E2C01_027096 [Portunus trituberculatus]|uniref:Uncharacterized protein n=1 Tax=Portunus trituberculatus TaxID=210409 RepID=A0A5B7EKG1_PORTR|nr:hypothetical protein [Portunus trituberculatus]
MLHCQGLQEIIVHKEDTGRLLEILDVRKAMGPDGVSGWTLKEYKDQLLDPIWEMVTISLKKMESTTGMEESQHTPHIQRRKVN